ncbi:hypothetical protein B0J17DRAFT_773080 [Rhizoctonia solani]|nr:hypothetical protein B0J17DRAFT_773080 [Rhizoctonia solani]
MSSSNFPPWDLLSFTFGSDPNITTTISQCSTVTLGYQGVVGGRVVNPSPTPPYSLVFYSDEFEPWSISMNNSGIISGYQRRRQQLTVPRNPYDCEQWVSPYTLEFISFDHRTPKTMRFALSPFRLTLDISPGIEYWLVIYDSRGGSGVKGPYQAESSSDDSCLGAAATMTAGRFSTAFALSANTAIIVALLIPLGTIVFASVLLRLCFKHSSRYYPLDPPHQPRTECPPNCFSEYMLPVTYGSENTDMTLDQKISGTLAIEPPDSAQLKKFINPDLHHLGPVEVEPFELEATHEQSKYYGASSTHGLS